MRFEKLRKSFCIWTRHSRIIETCFGYQYCGRCMEEVGDTLGGIGIGVCVVIGHNCDACKENYKGMTFLDKFLVKNPFTKEASDEA